MIKTRIIINSFTFIQEKNEELLMKFIKVYIYFWFMIFLDIHQNNDNVLKFKIFLIFLFYCEMNYIIYNCNVNYNCSYNQIDNYI
jgi:hypothetical protein